MTQHGEPPRDSQGRPMRYNPELSERLTMALNTQADVEALPETHEREQEQIDRERDIINDIFNLLMESPDAVDHDLTDHLEINYRDGSIVSITVSVTLP